MRACWTRKDLVVKNGELGAGNGYIVISVAARGHGVVGKSAAVKSGAEFISDSRNFECRNRPKKDRTPYYHPGIDWLGPGLLPIESSCVIGTATDLHAIPRIQHLVYNPNRLKLVFLLATMGDRIPLSSLRALTLYAGRYTAARRTAPVPQLECTGYICRDYQPSAVQCTNTGGSSTDIDWKVRP